MYIAKSSCGSDAPHCVHIGIHIVVGAYSSPCACVCTYSFLQITMNRRMVKFVAYAFLILLVSHECIAIATKVNQHDSMMKNIENHVQQQMRKNMMGKLTNNKIQSGKTSKAMVLKTRGHIHSLITKRAKDLRLARQDLETRMHQCHQNHKATEYDHILKASDNTLKSLC